MPGSRDRRPFTSSVSSSESARYIRRVRRPWHVRRSTPRLAIGAAGPQTANGHRRGGSPRWPSGGMHPPGTAPSSVHPWTSGPSQLAKDSMQIDGLHASPQICLHPHASWGVPSVHGWTSGGAQHGGPGHSEPVSYRDARRCLVGSLTTWSQTQKRSTQKYTRTCGWVPGGAEPESPVGKEIAQPSPLPSGPTEPHGNSDPKSGPIGTGISQAAQRQDADHSSQMLAVHDVIGHSSALACVAGVLRLRGV